MKITKEIAAQMESCIKQTHIEVTRQYSQGKILEVNGGAACFSGVDSFLSQVVGWGFTTQPKHFKRDLTIIEHFYQSLAQSRIDIELCPFVGNALAVYLSKQGYKISELNNVSAFDLSSYKKADRVCDGLNIRLIEPTDLQQWAKSVAMGFGYPEAQEQFSHYARAHGVSAFAVFDGDRIIAGATLAMHGDVCDLGVTSTLPRYRGKGLQKMLLFTRLNFAKEHGLRLATVTTEPGTISDLNIQKIGFSCAYTRIKMTGSSSL